MRSGRSWAAIVVLLAAGATISRGARAQTVPARKSAPPPAADSTARRLDELDQRIRVLERELEQLREEMAAARRSAVVVSAGADGFALTAPDGAFQLRLRGYVQEDGRFFQGAAPAGASTFLLRRVRPILDARLFGHYDVRLMPDFGNGATVLQDAYVDVHYLPQLRVRAGKFKPPVGLERLTSATGLSFVERGLPSDLIPNRDVGVQLSGELGRSVVAYAVGVFNGVPDGAAGDADADDHKELAGRVFVQPFAGRGAEPLRGLGLGIAGTTGMEQGTPSAPGLPGYKSEGQRGFFAYRGDGTPAGTTVADGRHTRLVPQARYTYRGLGALAEYAVSAQRVRRDSVLARVRNRAWQVAATYALTGEDASATGLAPRRDFDPGEGGWGAWELAARYSALALDGAAFPLLADPTKSARRAGAWTLGINWYLNTATKLVVNFQRTGFRGGAASGDRPAERAVVSRVQLSF